MLSTQVLIIGAGPVGMISALCLAQSGIRCALVDKRLALLDAPKAHAVNPRTLEICERLGVSADQISAAGASVADGGQVHFVDTLSTTCFGSLPYERQDAGARAFTPWPLVNIPQPTFEAFLAARLARCKGITLLRGLSATHFRETSDEVVTTLAGEGLQESVQIRADYVIAADGAGSTSRDLLDIGLTGAEGLAHNMMIHFEADLRSITQAHPGLLYFCLSPAARGVFIGYQRERTWVFMQAYDPHNEGREDFDNERCRALIEAAAGTAIRGLTIRNVSPWTMCAQVADGYRKGRVFLAGDAAHRFPPTGGLGLNTGIADAENLAWKLAKVLHRQAPPALLDTYESERRPVAQINSQQSLTNSAKIMHLFAAVYGPDARQTAEYYAAVCADPDAHPAVAQAVEVQRPHFDSFNLQLGYRYGDSDSTPVDPDTMDISCYEPSFEPGHHLPLVTLASGEWLLGQLPSHDFTLLTGPDGTAWRGSELATLIEGADFTPKDTFYQRAGLQRSGALLIRPDGHIAARWVRAPAEPQATVAAHLASVLSGTPYTPTQEN